MIEIYGKVSNSKVLSLSKKILGNKMDNSITKVIFKDISEEGQLLNKYVVFCSPNKDIFLFPLKEEDNSFIVSSAITTQAGDWQMLYLSTNNEISEDGEIDNDYKIYISNATTFQITDNFLEGNIDESLLDPNLKVIYDDLNNTVIYLNSDEFKEELIQSLHLSDEDVETIINNLKNDEDFKNELIQNFHLSDKDVQTITNNLKNDEEFKNELKGKDGYTPQRSVDYWTPEDIQTIENYCKNYIDTEILGGVS